MTVLFEMFISFLDEIDSSTARLISVNRFKRNYDFIDQILSPYNMEDITPPSIFPDASSQKVDNLNAKLVNGDEIVYPCFPFFSL